MELERLDAGDVRSFIAASRCAGYWGKTVCNSAERSKA